MVQVCAEGISNASEFTDTWKEGRHQPIPLNPPVRADGLYICRIFAGARNDMRTASFA
jgi:hypothetical protein